MVPGRNANHEPSTDELTNVFLKYASETINGEPCISADDFIRRYIELFPHSKTSDEMLRLLATIADTDHDGFISFKEFKNLERVLYSPDALYRITFRLFDRKSRDRISYNDFKHIVKMTELYDKFPFSFDCNMVVLYFGNDRRRSCNFMEFSQLLNDFPVEYAKQIFQSKDNGTGLITNEHFRDIMTGLKRRSLTGNVKDKLGALTEGNPIAYGFFRAFTSLLENIESLKFTYLEVTKSNRSKALTKDELFVVGETISMNPLEVEILYKLVALTRQHNTINYNDLCTITPQQDVPVKRSILIQLLESTYRFALGALAGGTGAFAAYPIDMVKTRMQNQRIKGGVRMYNNFADCLVKIIRNEGIRGLYRGVLVQVLGIAPEKAVKLSVNDFVRGKFSDKHGNVSIKAEILAGMIAGFCHDLITNPVEIVKIRLQTAGKVDQNVRAIPIIRELGPKGLYRGFRACLLRDVPFGGIYFSCYSRLKKAFADDSGYNPPITVLASGIFAAIPAASLVTPADVIKTRLQVIARTGQTKYKGITDAIMKILREEGPGAFWKGVVPRILKSSPQLGITLITYELLQRFLDVDFGGHGPAGSKKESSQLEDSAFTTNPDLIGGYKRIVPILNNIETRFGLCLPRFGRPDF